MTYIPVPWKRNLANVPESIAQDVQNLDTDRFIVAQTKKIPVKDIADKVYAHLGLKVADGVVAAPEKPILPKPQMGKWSERNRFGWERKRTDLPKIIKTFYWETPNFGDGATYGWHTHSRDREVYPVEVYDARNYPLTVEILNEPTGADGVALVKFSVGVILDRKQKGLEYDFLLCLNLLQENAGVAGIFKSTASKADFIGTIALDWQVFPPGTADEIVTAMLKGKTVSRGERGIVAERVKLFNSLKPTALLRGSAGFGSYVGARFADDLVVFENFKGGNALYVLYDDWQDVSKRSRIDLIRGTSEKFDRFVHIDGWEVRFKAHMAEELKKRRGKRML